MWYSYMGELVYL